MTWKTLNQKKKDSNITIARIFMSYPETVCEHIIKGYVLNEMYDDIDMSLPSTSIAHISLNWTSN